MQSDSGFSDDEETSNYSAAAWEERKAELKRNNDDARQDMLEQGEVFKETEETFRKTAESYQRFLRNKQRAIWAEMIRVEKDKIESMARAKDGAACDPFGMRLFAQTENGQRIGFTADGDDTIAAVKAKIQRRSTGLLPAHQQKIIFAGREMDDNKALKDYDVHEENTVHVIVGERERTRVCETDY